MKKHKTMKAYAITPQLSIPENYGVQSSTKQVINAPLSVPENRRTQSYYSRGLSRTRTPNEKIISIGDPALIGVPSANPVNIETPSINRKASYYSRNSSQTRTPIKHPLSIHTSFIPEQEVNTSYLEETLNNNNYDNVSNRGKNTSTQNTSNSQFYPSLLREKEEEEYTLKSLAGKITHPVKHKKHPFSLNIRNMF